MENIQLDLFGNPIVPKPKQRVVLRPPVKIIEDDIEKEIIKSTEKKADEAIETTLINPTFSEIETIEIQEIEQKPAFEQSQSEKDGEIEIEILETAEINQPIYDYENKNIEVNESELETTLINSAFNENKTVELDTLENYKIINETTEITDFKKPSVDKSTLNGNKKRGKKSAEEMDETNELVSIPADEDLYKKHYYSITEVVNMFGVSHAVVRSWCASFNLQPRTSKKGERFFKPDDIKTLELIHYLLRVRKFTVFGAKDYLKSNKKIPDNFKLIQELEQIAVFLTEIKANL